MMHETITVASIACPECRMEHRAWKGNDGRGYPAEGKVYCCQGCFEGMGCECESLQDEVYELELQRVARHRRDEEELARTGARRRHLAWR